MLDLDKIAGERAGLLSQDARAWSTAVWSEAFQSLSGRLTDGEVVELLGLCTSASDLEVATRLLGQAPPAAGVTPYDWLKAQAGAAGLSPGEWIRRTAGVNR